MLSWLLLSTLVCLVAVFILYWLHNQWQLDILVTPVAPPELAPLVSVMVPARNEARNIRRCVESLLAQDYPNLQIIVLDDQSEDDTPLILGELSRKENRLLVLSGSGLPRGWAGKPHALYQAQAQASGAWLLFLDADTFLAPSAVSSTIGKAVQTGADLFTIMNDQQLGSFWERTVMPLVFTALSVGFSPRKVNDPHHPDAIANGQFILIRREVYDAVGGHATLKGSIVEDKELAVLVKRSGYRLVVANGRQVAQTRMYTSLPEMWEGWTKNIYLGLKDQPGLLWLGVFGVFLAVTAALFLPAWPLLGWLWFWQTGGWMGLLVLVEALLVWTVLLYWRLLAARDMHIPAWYALTTPIGAAVFAAMMFTSAWKVLSGRGVNWKGRVYQNR